MAKETRSAFCPVCGVSHGQRRISHEKGGTGYYLPAETENYWEWLINKDKERPPGSEAFGIIQEVGQGKGKSFRVLGYYGPEDDQDGYYPAVKRRLLDALSRWLQRGWLTRAELDKATGAPSKKPARATKSVEESTG